MVVLKSISIFIIQFLPSILLTWISLIFITRRISHKISISYSMIGSRHTATRLSNIILYNKKDRVEIIKKVELVINKKYVLSILDFINPKVIKPFECITFETEPITKFVIGSEPIEIHHFMQINDYYFNIYTENKIIKIKKKKSRKISQKKIKHLENIQIISKVSDKYNDVVISDSIIFAILYIENGIHKTAFIDDSGFIDGEWGFGFNALPIIELKDSRSVYSKLESVGLLNYVEKFEIDDLRKTFWKTKK